MILAILLGAGLLFEPVAVRTNLGDALTLEARAGFSGDVRIARGDTMEFHHTYGNAAVPGEEAPSFWLASNSKAFTAAAILLLQESGRLRVTDSIGHYFKNVPADKRAITLHHLLTHTTGLPHAYRADGIPDRDRAVAEILKLKLGFRPGEKYSYSNDGYTLLAAIVDLTSGVGFDAFLRDSVLARGGMTQAGVWGGERPEVRIARLADPRRVRGVSPTIYRNGRSVGNWGYRGPTGLYASAQDVQHWIASLWKGRILSEASRRAMLGRHVLVREDSTGQSFTGYGWGVRVENGRDVSYGHSGNEDWLGHNGVMRFTPDGAIVVVLSNAGDVNGSGWSSRVNRAIRRVLE